MVTGWLAGIAGLLACFAAAAASAADYPAELQARARALRLAQDPQWHLLLHYRPQWFGGVRSEADGAEFFNAPDGKRNPEAELDATLAAFFSGLQETDKQQNPQCRFIARYRWLKNKLGFDPARLLEQPCLRYRNWRAQLAPERVTLVFPTAYLNSPSSMYGHTLLRIDGAGQDDRTRLLAYTISYAAQTDESNGFLFAYRGLFGGYPGRFGMMPYYLKVAEYSDLESRDVWEYELSLEAGEIERLLEHTWELGPTHFDYYFLDENCAYQLLALLDVARPALGLTARFPLWTIPAETVREAVRVPGLVRRIVYRPARSTEVRHQAAALAPAELEAAEALALGRVPPEDVLGRNDVRKGPVLDLAYDYLEYRRLAGKARTPDAKPRLHGLLMARSQVDDPAGPPPPQPAVRPDEGHLASRLGIGAGTVGGNGFQELRYRPAYHDQLDPQAGYRAGAQIEFMSLAVRHENGESLRLQKATVVNVMSVSPRERLMRPVSWRADIGFDRLRRPGGREAPVLQVEMAGGGAWQAGGALAYAMAEGTLLASRELDRVLVPALGVRAGVVMEPHERWRLEVRATAAHAFSDSGSERWRLALHQNVELSPRWSLRIEADVQQAFGFRWSTVGAFLNTYLR